MAIDSAVETPEWRLAPRRSKKKNGRSRNGADEGRVAPGKAQGTVLKKSTKRTQGSRGRRRKHICRERTDPELLCHAPENQQHRGGNTAGQADQAQIS